MDLTDWLDNQPPPHPCVKGKEKFSISEALNGNIINFSKTSRRILKALHYKNRDKCQLTVTHEIISSSMVKPVRGSSGN